MLNIFCNHWAFVSIRRAERRTDFFYLWPFQMTIGRRLFCLSSSEITLEGSDRLRLLKTLTKHHMSLVGVLQLNDSTNFFNCLFLILYKVLVHWRSCFLEWKEILDSTADIFLRHFYDLKWPWSFLHPRRTLPVVKNRDWPGKLLFGEEQSRKAS